MDGDSSGGNSSPGITYFSEAQLPRSISLHRSLQNGMKGSLNLTSFLQIGHFINRTEPYPGLDHSASFIHRAS